MEAQDREKRLVAEVLDGLNEVVGVGHISQGDVLQLLVSVGPPGDILDVSGWCVEYLFRPRSWIVIIFVMVRHSWVENLTSTYGQVSIFLEILGQCHNIWEIVPELVTIIITSYGIWSSSSQK